MPPDPLILKRSELRKAGLDARGNIPENIRDAYSQLIRKKVIDYVDSVPVKCVHTYIGFNTEVETKGMIEDLFDRKIQVVVPVVRGDRMIHSAIKDFDHILPASFGIPEPKKVTQISMEDIDVVLIPVVAFDGFGMRLGYGKGFYDRFLSSLSIKVRRIGLAFSIQEMEKIPRFSHDQLMNAVITEQCDFFFDL